MALVRIGTAEFTYSSGPVITHQLQRPLSEIIAGTVKTRYDNWALDSITREVVTVGNEANEIIGTVRADISPTGLRALLIFGANGGTINYYEASGGTAYPCQLVSPGGSNIQIAPDRDWWFVPAYEIQIRLRRIDAGNFDALLT